MAALLALSVFINTATILDDAHRQGEAMPLWRPLTLEATSSLGILAASAIIFVVVRLARPARGRLWRAVAWLLGGSLVFSGAHIALMTLFRFAAFAAQGHAYTWSAGLLAYEYRKDLLAYAVFAGLIWAFGRARPTAPALPPAGETPLQTFDIRDGQSLVRAPVAEIVAAHAAGNYVEFLLADGRRPLMRASLAAIEARLAPAGLVRTHRSWLVNAARVRGLEPAGSGDFRIDLGCGVSAPLSRRYPMALARLRDGAQP
ncbi:MAG TPA: LytTR family DNA-binding domain-containing protein [Caulobacteraceae bacterium]|nr:LytTR family DNA-binding domain-containing protein [Caulobacteraceae bacterium]